MIVESGILHVKPGEEAKFEIGIGQARPALEGAAGCHKMELRRCVETPSDYLILVWWDRVDDHKAFTESESFGAWLGPIVDFMAEPGQVYHYGEPI